MDVWVAVYGSWDEDRVEGVYASISLAKAAYPRLQDWVNDGDGGCFISWEVGHQPFVVSLEKHTVKS